MSAKQKVGDLALFGGVPLFREPHHVGRPNVGDRRKFFERLNDILDRRTLTNNGPYVQELEAQVAGLLKVRSCVATCNGTLALEIAVRSLGMSGEVIVPSLTFIATAHALQWQGITPVFCDVDPGSLTLDPARVEKAITPRTTGIIGVHLWGRPCAVEPLAELARRKNLRLLFDSTHALGCSYQGRMIGSFGNAEVFSFHATKFVNSFEGGAVVTDDDALAEKLRLMRNFGFAGYDKVVSIGTNAKMDEAAAAMGLTSLEGMEQFAAANRRNYERYRSGLEGIRGARLLAYDEKERCNYQYVVLDIDAAETGVSRDQIMELLWAENILARRYFYPGCHRMEPYRTLFPKAGEALPVTERVLERVLTLPTGTAVSDQNISSICAALRFIVEHGAEVRRAFKERKPILAH